MHILSFLPYEVFLIFVYMSAWFGVSILIKKNDIADVAWGFGFVAVYALALSMNPDKNMRGTFYFLLVMTWAVRLSGYILVRNFGKPEDQRYQKMRESWGRKQKIKSFLIVFMLQGALIVVVSTPVVSIALSSSNEFGAWDILGIFLCVFGFIFEVLADAQKSEFKDMPGNRRKLMMTGLWKYSRHPNYFGEMVIWWGFFCAALGHGALWTIIGPITISFLLARVSGVPMIEASYKGRPGFREYKETTSALVPWFKKSPKA